MLSNTNHYAKLDTIKVKNTSKVFMNKCDERLGVQHKSDDAIIMSTKLIESL